ncbi:MAG: hypothetical protein NTZ50_00835 [Chloroflexi bacterium]|nr:hypothetical protein [Chloroflexota bacterium]
MKHSRFAPAYAAVFFLCGALLIGLNLPRADLPTQDMGLLWRDPWFLWGFVHFSLLLMPAAVLLVADGLRRHTRAWLLVFPYFALGMLALAPYLALRPVRADDVVELPSWLDRALRSRWFWAVCAAASVVAALVLLPQGSWAQLQETMRHGFGWWFMVVDIVLNQVFVLPLVQADMRLCGVGETQQRRWLWGVALSGPLGLNAYLARRRFEGGSAA